MKTTIIILGLTAVLSLAIVGCSRNPVLNVSPDEFAKAVDDYERPMWRTDAQMCGPIYAENDPEVHSLEVQKDCGDFFKDLAEYLHKYPAFKSVTAADLATAEVWKHYFSSKLAYGRGTWLKEIGIKYDGPEFVS